MGNKTIIFHFQRSTEAKYVCLSEKARNNANYLQNKKKRGSQDRETKIYWEKRDRCKGKSSYREVDTVDSRIGKDCGFSFYAASTSDEIKHPEVF